MDCGVAGRQRARASRPTPGGVGHRLHAEHLLWCAAAAPDPPDAALTLTAVGDPERAALVEGDAVGARARRWRTRSPPAGSRHSAAAGRCRRVGDVEVTALVERQPRGAARRGDRADRHRVAAARRHAHDRAVAGAAARAASRGCPWRPRSGLPARACSCGPSSTRRRPRAGGSRRLPSPCDRPRRSIPRVWLQPPSRRRAEWIASCGVLRTRGARGSQSTSFFAMKWIASRQVTIANTVSAPHVVDVDPALEAEARRGARAATQW